MQVPTGCVPRGCARVYQCRGDERHHCISSTNPLMALIASACRMRESWVMCGYASLFYALQPVPPRSLPRLWLQHRYLLDQAQRLSNRSIQLRVHALNIILRRDIHLNIGVGAVVLHIPAHIFEPESPLWLRGHSTIDQSVAWIDANHASPGALANQWPQFHELEGMAEYVAI